MIKKALILGGGGSIASEIARKLQARGYAISVVDIKKSDRVPAGFKFIQKNIFKDDVLETLIAEIKPSVIINAVNIATIYSHVPAQGYSKLIQFYVRLYQSLQHLSHVHYLQIGTTGTGGLGFNVPYTHGETVEDLPLIHKGAFAGIGTAMLVLLSRSFPDQDIQISELKPGLAVFNDQPKTSEWHGCPLVLLNGGENGDYSYQEVAILTTLMPFTTIDRLSDKALAILDGKTTSQSVSPYDTVAAMNATIIGSEPEDIEVRDRILADMLKSSGDNAIIATGDLGPPSLTRDLILGSLWCRHTYLDEAGFTDQLKQKPTAQTFDFIQQRNPELFGYLKKECTYSQFLALQPFYTGQTHGWELVAAQLQSA